MRTRAVTILVLVAVVFLVAATLAACGDDGDDTTESPTPTAAGSATYTEAQNDQTVEGTAGQTVIVRLEENPTTGYQWRMETSTGLEEVSSQYEGPTESPAPVGAGGVHVWSYRIGEPGMHVIEGKYVGPDGETVGATYLLRVDAM